MYLGTHESSRVAERSVLETLTKGSTVYLKQSPSVIDTNPSGTIILIRLFSKVREGSRRLQFGRRGDCTLDLGAFNPPAVELSLKKKESQSKYLNIISFPVSVV